MTTIGPTQIIVVWVVVAAQAAARAAKEVAGVSAGESAGELAPLALVAAVAVAHATATRPADTAAGAEAAAALSQRMDTRTQVEQLKMMRGPLSSTCTQLRWMPPKIQNQLLLPSMNQLQLYQQMREECHRKRMLMQTLAGLLPLRPLAARAAISLASPSRCEFGLPYSVGALEQLARPQLVAPIPR